MGKAMDDAGSYAGDHLAPETMTVLLNFSAPTRELSNYSADRLIAGMKAMGAGSVIQLDGDIIDSDLLTISQTVGAETIVIGSITQSGDGGQLELRTIDGSAGMVLGEHTTVVQMDETFAALLDPKAVKAAETGPAEPAATPEPAAASEPAAARTPRTPGPRTISPRTATTAATPEPDSAAEPADWEEPEDRADGDFSVGRRIASAAMNPLLGLGSYTMGDWAGGLVITGGYGMAGSLIAWDIVGVKYEDEIAGVPGGVGLGLIGVTTAFGILRPIFYHRPGSGRDFTVGRRIASAAMNPLLGLGSYTMGDVGGGLIITGGYGIAAGLILWDVLGVKYEDKLAGVPGAVGLGVAGMTTLFGIFRPIFYDNPIEKRALSAALNPLFGIGSYMMGDWDGGLVINGGYGIAAGLILWDIYGVRYEDKFAGIPGTVGLGVAGATVLFSILRPIFYNRSGSPSKFAGVLKGVQVAIVPDTSGIKAVRLGYNLQF
ncbi:hypothetical protein AGMMS49940_05410 [Spirochaetia bacterium]|nr:hypothetical protein AGMMS49940_05410 [Spirochaetia bacterium]